MLNKRNVKINKCLNVLIRKIRITQVKLSFDTRSRLWVFISTYIDHCRCNLLYQKTNLWKYAAKEKLLLTTTWHHSTLTEALDPLSKCPRTVSRNVWNYSILEAHKLLFLCKFTISLYLFQRPHVISETPRKESVRGSVPRRGSLKPMRFTRISYQRLTSSLFLA